MVTTAGRIDTLDATEIARRPLQADECALVVVDIQEKLLPPIFNKEQLVSNSQLLVRFAQILNIPVLLTTQYTKGLGPVIAEIASLVPGPPHRQDGVQLLWQRRFLQRREIASRAAQTPCFSAAWKLNICVLQTALAALNNGYLVHVASDAIGSRAEWNWRVGLDRMRSAGCVISKHRDDDV